MDGDDRSDGGDDSNRSDRTDGSDRTDRTDRTDGSSGTSRTDWMDGHHGSIRTHGSTRVVLDRTDGTKWRGNWTEGTLGNHGTDGAFWTDRTLRIDGGNGGSWSPRTKWMDGGGTVGVDWTHRDDRCDRNHRTDGRKSDPSLEPNGTHGGNGKDRTHGTDCDVSVCRPHSPRDRYQRGTDD